jgi:hypothetical protein
VTWLVLTAAGLVAETVVIVVLGRSVTARYESADTSPRRPAPAALARTMDVVGEANA